MDNTASKNSLKQEKWLRDGEGNIIHGVLVGPPEPGSTDIVAVSGVTIQIRGAGRGTVSTEIISSAGGDFSSIPVPSGKYVISFQDPSGKYYHPPITKSIQTDYPLPVTMGLTVEAKKGRGGHRQAEIGKNNIEGLVVDRKKKPIPDMSINVRSVTLDPPKKNILDRFKSLFVAQKKESDEAKKATELKTISIDLKTNKFGLFRVAGMLPNGAYTIKCKDQSQKYKFVPKHLVLKGHYVQMLYFVAYTAEDIDELKKKFDEEKNKRLKKDILIPTDEEVAETAKRGILTAIKSKFTRKQPEKQLPRKEQSKKEQAIDELGKDKKAAVAEAERILQESSKGPGQIKSASKPPSQEADIQTQPKIQKNVGTAVLEKPKSLSPSEMYKIPPPVSFPIIKTIIRPPSLQDASATLSQQKASVNNVRVPNEQRRRAPAAPQIPRPNAGQNAAADALKPVTNFAKSQLKKYLIGAAIIVLFVVIIIEFFGPGAPVSIGNSSGTNTGSSTGGSSGPSSSGTLGGGGLDYSIPINDPSILPDDIKQTISKNWPNATQQNIDDIVNTAKSYNWNPSFLLSLWIEESGGQSGSYTDALGCDPSHPTTNIDVSLKCFFNQYGSYSKSFADFMCNYSESRDAPCDFSTNPNFPNTVKSVYATLVPSGPGAETSVSPAPGLTANATCPIPGGKITCGSLYNTVNGCGHCNPNTDYSEDMQYCNYNGINYAEDIGGTAGENVLLPSINGQSAIWRKNLEATGESGYGIIGYTENTSGPTYSIEFHDVQPGSGTNQGVSGQTGAKICSSCDHVHVEFYTTNPSGNISYIDASKTFCQ